MADQNPHREEIREILLGSPSHYASTLRDLESGLSVQASAEKREVKPERKSSPSGSSTSAKPSE
jgi:hypothetical protein